MNEPHQEQKNHIRIWLYYNPTVRNGKSKIFLKKYWQRFAILITGFSLVCTAVDRTLSAQDNVLFRFSSANHKKKIQAFGIVLIFSNMVENWFKWIFYKMIEALIESFLGLLYVTKLIDFLIWLLTLHNWQKEFSSFLLIMSFYCIYFLIYFLLTTINNKLLRNFDIRTFYY